MLNYLQILLIGMGSVVGLLFGLVRLWAWEENRKKRRKPSKEKLLRSPGEYLRMQIEANDEKLLMALVILCSVPTTIVATFFSPNKPAHINWIEFEPAVCVGGIIVLAAVGRMIHLLRKGRDLRLGYSGERAVGEELNKLMLDGFQVFHDVPFDKYNIDHVVVGSSGVYAVETKARSKGGVSKKSKLKDYELVYDGKVICYPCGSTDTEHLEQARINGKSLADFLSKSTGEVVGMEAILTYPGWYVLRQGRGDVHVLSPKEIRKCVVRNGPPVLSDQRIRQIVHQLDQKCRTVEF